MCFKNIQKDFVPDFLNLKRESKKTQIIATVGPESNSYKTLTHLAEEGVNIFRLNMSHGNHTFHKAVIEIVRVLKTPYGRSPLILVDLQGPKLRVGKMQDGGVRLEAGQQVILTTEQIIGSDGRIPIQLLGSLTAIQPGERIFFDDGLLETIVVETKETELIVEVIVGGKLTDKKGMNFPDSTLDIPALTEKDYEDAQFAVENGADWIALSFVRQASDVETLRAYLYAQGRKIPIVSKIEKPEAINNIDSIIAVSDGVMVARGDLGVEINDFEVPEHQKRIIGKCQRQGIFCIVATQMMDSMIRRPRPTRAEVSDVANAVYDGTNAVMLSGETANGKYPVESVQKMAEIVTFTEMEVAKKRAVVLANRFKSSYWAMPSDLMRRAYAISHDLKRNCYKDPYTPILLPTNAHEI